MYYIVHSSIDEAGKSKGGAVGDQTGREVCTRTWYSKPWGMVLRCKNASIAKKARNIAIKLANSNLVGYDQNERNTLYKQLERNGWDVDKYIKSGVKTESDCSSFVYACYCCVLAELRGLDNAPTTSTAKSFYSSHGFEVFTSSAYTASANQLKQGDLLNNAGHHIVMFAGTNVSVASKKNKSKDSKKKTSTQILCKGSTGPEVKTLQKNLNAVMSLSLEVDGEFGTNTYNALKAFQSNNGLTCDGIYGQASRAKMREALNKCIPALASASPNLKKGSRGKQVKLLQQDLNYAMPLNLDADGIFGTKTYDCLKSFQASRNITSDGIYGSKTKAELAKVLV